MWAAIIMMLLSYFLSKKSGASDKQAMLTAAGVGAGTYYVATQTEWGQENLNWFESDADSGGTATTTPTQDSAGNTVRTPSGSVVTEVVGSTADVLKSWGGTGTAAVIGTAAMASSSSLQKYLPWIAGGILIYLLVK